MNTTIKGLLYYMVGTTALMFAALTPIMFFSISYISSAPSDPTYFQLISQMQLLTTTLFCIGAGFSSFGIVVIGCES